MMNRNLYILLIVFTSQLLLGCVDRYFLDENVSTDKKLVVDGLLKNNDSIQIIRLSLSSSPEAPEHQPLLNAIVEVVDEENNSISFNEIREDGVYSAIMGSEYFHEGAKFKLRISANGQNYESNWEEFLYCPPVDSLYYEVKEKPTNNPQDPYNGLQFYLDFKASDDYGKFYRFDVIETYEYTASFEIDAYYIGYYVFTPDDYSLYTCYRTRAIDEIFTLSTQGFTENTYIKYHLHYVNDRTQRLLYQYSILINQYSLSEDAYYYWETLKLNNQESGSLYDTQPAQIIGNIYNINDDKEKVLGYFGVSAVTSKRITMKTVDALSFTDINYCGAVPLEMSLAVLPSSAWPIYLVYRPHPDSGADVLCVGAKRCFDCREDGGVLEKPDYFE